MIAVDTNILVYAHRTDSPFHKAADRCLGDLAESGNRWAIPWPCIHEFIAIVTHPKIYAPPTALPIAIKQVEAWLECPTLEAIGETEEHWPVLKSALLGGNLRGPAIHDARVAAICVQHGVRVLWSQDRAFPRIAGVKIANPLVDS